MIARIFKIFIIFPILLILLAFMIANRGVVTVSLDPINTADPAVAFAAPLYILLALAFVLGLFFGGIKTWLSQGKHRKTARLKRKEADQWHKEADTQKQRADELDPSVEKGLPPALAKLADF